MRLPTFLTDGCPAPTSPSNPVCGSSRTAPTWTEAPCGFTELLFVLRVGDAGGLIDRVWVDYQVGGEEYTLRIEWQMIACGESIPQVDGREVCDGTAE